MNYFELDPVHFYSTLSLTWSAGIKTTNVTLELLTDINMYLMLESGIRGGMCLVSKRYSKANNKYLDNFDEMSPSKFIISLDVNNLYGTTMAFYILPESEFRFLNKKEIDKFDLMSFDMLRKKVVHLYKVSFEDKCFVQAEFHVEKDDGGNYFN
ncbi:uncharacterized protein TNCT_519921 [Trichonephila clavata]|uniref:DNA-directed DNA polymerase n=1 Tax=Trichonephila clavata TaxID=2740835 RepID=A0A8X6LCW2_TRICU|nr:uncharacterized protein TNCT_519921 [Trichonephila clavata]